MAWFDRYNSTTSSNNQTPNNRFSGGGSATPPTWISRYKNTIDLADKMGAGGTTQKPFADAVPTKFPPNAKIGQSFVDPVTKEKYKYTDIGWIAESVIKPRSSINPDRQETAQPKPERAFDKLKKFVSDKINAKVDEVKDGYNHSAVESALRGDWDESSKRLDAWAKKYRETTLKPEELAQNFGGAAGTTKTFKAIAAEAEPAVIKGFLKQAYKEFSDDVADAVSKKLANITNPKTIQKELEFLTKVKRTELTGKGLSTSSDEILKGRQQAVVNQELKPQVKSQQITPQTPISSQTTNQTITPPYEPQPVAKTPAYQPPPQAPRPQGASIVDEVKEGFAAGRVERQAAEGVQKGSLAQRFKTEAIDRLTPVFDFVNQAAKHLPAEVNPYKKMRLLSGVGGKVEVFINDNIAPIFKKEKGRLDDLGVLQVLEREAELVGRGLTRKRGPAEIQQGLAELKAKYGEEGFATLQESSNQIRKVVNGLLDDLYKSGVVSEDGYRAIKQNNQFYTPMEAVEHIADNLEKGNFGPGNSFNVATQDVIHTIKSYTGDVGDPLEAIVRQIPKVIALTEKNNAIKALVDMRKQFPDTFSTQIVPIAEGSAPKGMEIINVFENGKNVRYAVPEVVGSAIKNLDAESAGILVKLGSIQAKILRAGATGLNIAFLPFNVLRDVQDALTTEFSEKGAKAMVRFLASYPEAIFSAAGKGKLWKEWMSSGGAQSTLTEQVFKNTTKTVKELSGQKNVIKTVISSPKGLIEFANRVGEQSTRLARYKSGVSSGEDAAEAAFKSRDISLDFAKAGNKIKVLNQIVPFLNAGIQGSEKLLRLYKDNPKMAIASTGTLFGMPTVALYNYNVQFKDFDSIPDSERQDNWIIIARDRTPEEKAAGEGVVGIKIPKGFLGRMVANTIDSSMDFMRKKDPSTFASAALDTVSGLSPVGLPYNQEKLSQSLSGILPPWIQAGLEATSNTNFYYNQPIVPKNLQGVKASEQYKENTPEIYKQAGKLTGVSPLLIENTVNTTTGGLGRQIANVASGKIKEGTVDQITRRFTNIKGDANTDAEFDEVAKFAGNSKTNALEKKREAESLFGELKQLPKEEATQRANALKKTDPVLFEKLKDVVEEEKLGLSSLERFVKTLPVEDGARAKYLMQKVNSFETKEEKNAYIKDMVEKKIVTPQVIQQLKKLNQDPLQKQSQAGGGAKTLSQLLDAVIPTARAADGESKGTITEKTIDVEDWFGSESVYTDYKTNDQTITHKRGKIERAIDTGVQAVKEFMTGKKSINTNLVDPKVSSQNSDEEGGPEIELGTSTPEGVKQPQVTDKGEANFQSVKRDDKYAENHGRSNYNPSQPPKEIAQIIKKYFPDDYATAVIVAATENGTYDPTRKDNVNKDGTKDRGIFQINENTFNGLMKRQPDALKSHDINSFLDMWDADKNAYVAKLIRDGSKQANPKTNGWGGWYGWQATGYDINNGWYSLKERVRYELKKQGRMKELAELDA